VKFIAECQSEEISQVVDFRGARYFVYRQLSHCPSAEPNSLRGRSLRARILREKERELAELRRCEQLSVREREVMNLVVSGMLNKQVAGDSVPEKRPSKCIPAKS
jgi:DNA-binding NarL/FixJ family response regulator